VAGTLRRTADGAEFGAYSSGVLAYCQPASIAVTVARIRTDNHTQS
jgi:hypothetical protein